MKIIQRGSTAKRITCPYCGSILEYEETDKFLYKEIDGGYGEYLNCPVCGKSISID